MSCRISSSQSKRTSIILPQSEKIKKIAQKEEKEVRNGTGPPLNVINHYWRKTGFPATETTRISLFK